MDIDIDIRMEFLELLSRNIHHISLWSSVLELDPQAGLGTLKREGECLE